MISWVVAEVAGRIRRMELVVRFAMAESGVIMDELVMMGMALANRLPRKVL